jgi:tRNA (cytidine/uridine-2'-O-)-methyltransferase
MNIHIVLLAPEIPQNTGTIGRLCVCLDARLHLIKPLGFQIDEATVRRAGLDYWQYVDLAVHDSWDAFLATERPARMHFPSTKGARVYYEVDYQPGDYLVFGRETTGLPPAFYAQYADQLCTIPMPGRHARSLNLANAVSVVVYEAYRQWAVRGA